MKKNDFVFVVILVTLLSICVSCSMPSPIYGTWSDNQGSTITFASDNTFVAIVNGGERIEGDYTVLLNSLVFNKSSGARIVTEWDIRGNMMYLDWVDEDGYTVALTLYKVAN